MSLIAAEAVERDPFNVSHMCREAERRVRMAGGVGGSLGSSVHQ